MLKTAVPALTWRLTAALFLSAHDVSPHELKVDSWCHGAAVCRAWL